jgi:hypothetical protein
MNTPDPAMPADFGLKYVFWVTCRWLYFNPLTVLMSVQGILFQVALDYPAWRWVGSSASALGVVIAQIRNRNKDYSAPISNQPNQPKEPK